MTATQAVALVGHQVVVRFEEINVACTVKDVKQSYGGWRFKVTPQLGSGEQWIGEVRFVDGPK
jgi:hypothetical protein